MYAYGCLDGVPRFQKFLNMRDSTRGQTAASHCRRQHVKRNILILSYRQTEKRACRAPRSDKSTTCDACCTWINAMVLSYLIRYRLMSHTTPVTTVHRPSSCVYPNVLMVGSNIGPTVLLTQGASPQIGTLVRGCGGHTAPLVHPRDARGRVD